VTVEPVAPPAPVRAATVAEYASTTEEQFSALLADVLKTGPVSTGSHFFDDLGADSLLMARFCARVRKHDGLPAVSMTDVYQHPTVRDLAAAVGVAEPAPEVDVPTASEPAPPAPVRKARTVEYVMCGALQFAIFLGYSWLTALVAVVATDWISGATNLSDIYARAVVAGSAALLGLGLLPVLAKWVLIGRWKRQQIPLWSLAYVRFWLVKTLVHANPVALFAVGTPLFSMYLRALGAKVGPGVVILSRDVPVCTDLLTIGAGTVIRKDTFYTGYRARAGVIETGSVTIGKAAFVGEKSVLDVDTEVGDGAQLGHTSSLHPGQVVPAGQRWHGSPARPTDVDYATVPAVPASTLRAAGYSVATLLKLLLVYMPLAEGGLFLLLTAVPALSSVLEPGTTAFTGHQLYLDAMVVSAGLFGTWVVSVVVAVTVPRLLHLPIRTDRVYPVYGWAYGMQRSIARMTNLKFFTWLFGDSSYIVHYLRVLGYDLGEVEQTGSNFGTEVRHETPYLARIGSGTMVADGLSVMNADYSATSFRLSHARIGGHNFLGNNIAYPVGGRTGENCLLATKVMIPLDGEVRHDVGLLGSPPFEIPRTVERDTRFDPLRSGEEFRRRLSRKNRYNLRSMALFLVLRWVHFLLLTTLGMIALDMYESATHFALAAFFAGSVVITTLWFVLIERCFTAFRPLKPRLCSIYEPYFWWHERLWKVPDTYLGVFNGTPFKNLVWRLLGVRLGRRVFDDGAFITERTLAAIGDDAVLNHNTKIQCHSQEDGTFKSDRVTLGAGVILGVGAFVHYGVTIGDGAELAADSFLMKGEEIPPHAHWGGNPAREVRHASHQPA
jgi:non-ribosomal peptide synthetase-like protein